MLRETLRRQEDPKSHGVDPACSAEGPQVWRFGYDVLDTCLETFREAIKQYALIDAIEKHKSKALTEGT